MSPFTKRLWYLLTCLRSTFIGSTSRMASKACKVLKIWLVFGSKIHQRKIHSSNCKFFHSKKERHSSGMPNERFFHNIQQAT